MIRTLASFRFVLGLLGGHRRRLVVGLLCLAPAAALLLWMPVLLGRALDLLRAARDDAAAQRELGELCLVLVLVTLADVALRFVARRNLLDCARFVEEDLKARVMAHVGRLPIPWFDRARSGDLQSRLTQDVELLRFLVGPALLHGASALLVIPAGALLMTRFSPLVTAGACAALLAMLGTVLLVLPRVRRHGRAVQECIGRISARAAEDFAGIQVLTAFARARDELGVLLRMNREYVEHNVRLSRARAVLGATTLLCRDLVVLGVVGLGAVEAARGRMTLGDIFAFLMMLGVLAWPLMSLGWILTSVHRSVAAAERIAEVLAAPPEPSAGRDVELRGCIELRDLTFTYPGQTAPALRGVSLRLEPGQKLGLVGPPGGGKSTLLALLLRLHDPPRGTVFVDGIDVLDLQPAALRRAFAVAPQEAFLFRDSIRGNVTFGDRDGSAESLAGALHAAALADDLPAFRDGVESLVGERGILLSGGQKQRVSLARALLTQRPSLVLDDTLSALDHHTEARVLQRLSPHREGRTVLVAAHRLAAVADADLVLVLERGAVVERGTHAELVAAGRDYAATWRVQRELAAFEARA